MKAIAALIVIGIGLVVYLSYNETYKGETEEAFRGFIEEYKVGYGSSEEYNYRLGIFQENMKRNEEYSRLNPEAIFGVTQFSDKTPEEMMNYMGRIKLDEEDYEEDTNNLEESIENEDEIIGDFDWSVKMAPIKNQGGCGNCWAFAAMAAVEGRYHLTYKKKPKVDVTFSEQQLTDCVYGSSRCKGGGFVNDAYNYLIKNGFMASSLYPYTAKPGICKANSKYFVGKLKSFRKVKAKNIRHLIVWAKRGPVSVVLNGSSLLGYIGGIIKDCGKGVYHAVTLVGVSTDGVYKLRNSWGTSWGERGYFRLAPGHTCGITSEAAYPIF